jgi:uncharacterized protein YjbJ (UPF0337 family)
MWNKTERDGKIDQATGKIKQAVGTLTGDDDLKAEGQADELTGKVETAVGRTLHDVADAVAHAGKALKR